MARPRLLDLDRVSFRLTIGTLAGIAFFFLIFPTAIVLLTSFTSTASLRFPPPGYSLRWYAALLDAHQMQQAALNSLRVAAVATVLSVLLGISGALAIARSTARWAKILDSIFMSPLLLPALAFGFAALLYFSLIGVPLSLTTLVLGHVAVCVPFVLRTTIASLAQLDPALLDASLSLGAGRFFTFRRVTLPLIGRGIAAGAFLAFMASFDNVPVSLFLRDARTDMLPIRMWQDLEGKLDVTIAAVSGVLIVFTIALMILMERVAGLSRRLR